MPTAVPTDGFVNWLQVREPGYALGFTRPDDVVQRLALIPEAAWTPVHDDEGVGGRVAAPSALRDSLSVRMAAAVGRATLSWDGRRKVAGRERYIVVDPGLAGGGVGGSRLDAGPRVAARGLLRRMRDTAGRRAALVWADGDPTGPSRRRGEVSGWGWRRGRSKIELVYRRSWRTRDEAENELFRHVDGFYDTERIQLGSRAPLEEPRRG